MKRSALITLTVMGMAVLFSCKKDEKTQVNELVGKWELKMSINGFTGQKENYPAGNGMIVEFGLKEYRFIDKNKTMKQGGYSIEKKISKITDREESYIIYDGVKDGIPETYTVKADELTLSIDAIDGPASIYKRLN